MPCGHDTDEDENGPEAFNTPCGTKGTLFAGMITKKVVAFQRRPMALEIKACR